MEIPELIQKLAGKTSFNDITLYEAEVDSVDIENRTAICRTIGGIDIPDITVTLMTTVGDGSYLVPAIGSNVYILVNPLINPFIIHYGEVSSVILTSSNAITLNSDEYGGLVKVQELTDKINKLENVVNNLITLYNAHIHVGPDGPSGPPTSLSTDVLQITNKTEIENDSITHGPKIPTD